MLLAARRILVEGDIECVDQVGTIPLDEPGDVFGEVLARLGDEVAEPVEYLEPHPVVGGWRSLRQNPPQIRIEVTTGVLKPQVERHMVDAGAEIVDIVSGKVEDPGELRGGALDTVAESHGLDGGRSPHCPGQHGHGIGVVHEKGVRTTGFHVPRHLQHHRGGAEGAHDPADAKGIADRLPQPVPLRNLEVDHGGRLVAADLDHVDDVVGSIQGAPPVCRRLDHWGRSGCLGNAMDHLLRDFKPLTVNVHQGDGCLVQLGKGEQITQQRPCEDGAPGTDKGDLWSTPAHRVEAPFLM